MSEHASGIITYCERWNDLLHAPINIIGADEAKRRHEAGELYSVVLGDLKVPDAFIEVNWTHNYLGVWFLDEKCRRVLKYGFRRVSETQLFMNDIVRWDYPPEARGRFNDALLIESIHYEQDGTVRQTTKDKTVREIVEKTIKDVPLDINWEKVPQFGQWDSVARYDREPPTEEPEKS